MKKIIKKFQNQPFGNNYQLNGNRLKFNKNNSDVKVNSEAFFLLQISLIIVAQYASYLHT